MEEQNFFGMCYRKQKHNTPESPKEIRATVECERIIPSNASSKHNTPPNMNHNRMDAVVHYMTTLPAIKNLICMTHHDYLPNEFEPIQIETDLYFQLVTLKHSEGQVEKIHFKLFCYDHEMHYIQSFIERCNLDY
jgi:hypothetical protein